MFISRVHYDDLQMQIARALERALAAEMALHDERERNRVREEALVDRILTKHNSRPVTPKPVEDELMFQRQPSPIEEATKRDFMAEEAENGLYPDTPGNVAELEHRWTLYQRGEWPPN
jgi:hypothetical protein